MAPETYEYYYPSNLDNNIHNLDFLQSLFVFHGFKAAKNVGTILLTFPLNSHHSLILSAFGGFFISKKSNCNYFLRTSLNYFAV